MEAFTRIKDISGLKEQYASEREQIVSRNEQLRSGRGVAGSDDGVLEDEVKELRESRPSNENFRRSRKNI